MEKTVVELRDAEVDFGKLTPLIRAGQVITLCEGNEPMAEIRPLPRRATKRRPFGLARGAFVVPPDFGAPDPEIERMFYGESK